MYCTCAHISQRGCTALHLAAQEGHEDVVELLLKPNADPELEKVRLHYAVHQANTTVLLRVLQFQPEVT